MCCTVYSPVRSIDENISLNRKELIVESEMSVLVFWDNKEMKGKHLGKEHEEKEMIT